MIKQLFSSAFVLSEELWRSQSVLSANSSDDTQPHSVIVNYI